MAFRVGQKVVCVDGSMPLNGTMYGGHPIKGQAYIIAAVEPSFVNVVEIPRSDGLCHWRASRFRSLQSTETSMQMLKALLEPRNHKNLEDAK